ncbi:MAG: hypothetical protein HQL63_13900 [Magnetococcales bacterium]|nr:hypothetical protein [Magnetococcales bacterium]
MTTLTYAGRALPCGNISMAIDEGSQFWVATVDVLDMDTFFFMQMDAPFSIDYNGGTFHFIVDSRQRERAFGELRMTVTGISPAARLAAPRASARILTRLAEAGGAGMDIESLERSTGLDRKQIANAGALLVRRGLMSRAKAGVYVITEAGLLAVEAGMAPRPGPRGSRCVTEVWRTSLRARTWAGASAATPLCAGGVGDGAGADAGAGRDRAGQAAGFIAWLSDRHRLRPGRQGACRGGKARRGRAARCGADIGCAVGC